MIKIIKKYFIFILIFGTLFSCKNKAYTSYVFTEEGLFTNGIEGPAVDSKGNLYAVNFAKEGTIGIVNKIAQVSLFATLPSGSIGNGIRFDKADNMYIADYTNHNILIIRKGSTEATVYAHDSTMNQPNDIAISSNGLLYASDPDWENNTGNLWMIKEDTCILLEKDMGTTNGIEVSPNGDKLYVNESVQRKIWAYDIQDDGSLKNKTLFASFPNFGLDGMRCDIKGNLYVCRYGKASVVVMSPQGKMIREILLKGKNPSNITFGGIDNKQCFVTVSDRGCFESFFSEFSGKGF